MAVFSTLCVFLLFVSEVFSIYSSERMHKVSGESPLASPMRFVVDYGAIELAQEGCRGASGIDA